MPVQQEDFPALPQHNRPTPLSGAGTSAADPGNPWSRVRTDVKFNQRLKRNVLEIYLERVNPTTNIRNTINDDSLSALFKTLKIDIKNHVQGYQICPGGVPKIEVLIVPGVSLDKFCREESIKVSDDIRTSSIRPSGKREVTVTISGLNFNTPDTFVMDYLNKHGRVVSTSPVYEKVRSGVFQGKMNGNRKYQVDFTKGINMGTYHIIDGSRVMIFYPGQKRTCGRCYRTAGGPDPCPGSAIAKNCAETGEANVKLLDHMEEHWRKIGFSPADFELEDNEGDTINDVEIKESGKFTPVRKRNDIEENDDYEGAVSYTHLTLPTNREV